MVRVTLLADIIAPHVCKVKGRYVNIDRCFNFVNFDFFSVIIIIFGISLDQKKNLYNNTKRAFTIKTKHYFMSTSLNFLSYNVLFSLIDAYTFRVIRWIFFWQEQMPQMLMITVKYVLVVGSFRNILNWSICRYYLINLLHFWHLKRIIWGLLATNRIDSRIRKHPIEEKPTIIGEIFSQHFHWTVHYSRKRNKARAKENRDHSVIQQL